MIDQTAPYPLILSAYLFSIVICLSAFVRLNVASEATLGWFWSAVLWSAMCLLLQMVLLGLPHHWSSWSLTGKLVAQLAANVVVFTASGFAIAASKKRGLRQPRPAIAGFLVGVLAIGPSIVIALFSVCLLTRDCL